MKKYVRERDIIQCAKKILQNTRGECLKEVLSDVIRLGSNALYYSPEMAGTYLALKRICYDGYDVSGFCLEEIPDEGYFIFCNDSNRECFDIHVKREDEALVPVVCYLDADNRVCEATSVQEAIGLYTIKQQLKKKA